MSDQYRPAGPDDQREPPRYGAYRPASSARDPQTGQPYSPQGGYGDSRGNEDAPASAPGYQPLPQQDPATSSYQPYGQPVPVGNATAGGRATKRPAGKLPGRGWPITLVVVGAVLAFIAAPLIFFGSIVAGTLNSLGQKEIDQFNQKGNVREAVFEAGDTIMVGVSPADGQWKCVATGPQGVQLQLRSEEKAAASSSFLAQAEAKTAGKYAIRCDSGNNTQIKSMFLVTPKLIRGAFSGVGYGLLWSSIVGVVGLVMFIVGLVWLVRVNRARRTLMGHAGVY